MAKKALWPHSLVQTLAPGLQTLKPWTWTPHGVSTLRSSRQSAICHRILLTPGSTATNPRLPPDPNNTLLPPAQAVSVTAFPHRSTPSAAHTTSRSAVTRSRITALPVTRPVKGRPGGMSKYYSTPGAQYSGRVSDLHSLARHKVVFYAQANIYGLMCDTRSPKNCFFDELFQNVSSLEEPFDKRFIWDQQDTNIAGLLRLWRSLKLQLSKQRPIRGEKLWKAYMSELYRCRFSSLKQINTKNISLKYFEMLFMRNHFIYSWKCLKHCFCPRIRTRMSSCHRKARTPKQTKGSPVTDNGRRQLRLHYQRHTRFAVTR